MYPLVNLSSTLSPLNISLIDQIMFSFPSPLFSVYPAFSVGDNSYNNISSSESPVSTAGCNRKVCATPEAAAGPVRNRRQRHEFCKICQKNITEEGKRSQGPRRHILQHHLCRPIFFCSLCPATSNYDKAHIRTHLNRIHKGFEGEIIEIEKSTFAKEEEHWFKRCFGEGAESRSNFIIKEQQKKKPELNVEQVKKGTEVKVEENADEFQHCFGEILESRQAAGQKKIKKEHEIKVEETDADYSNSKENSAPSSIPSIPILFSIDRILSGGTRNV